MTGWGIYRGEPGTHEGIADLPPPPPWRTFPLDGEALTGPPPESEKDIRRAESYRPSAETVELVNAALFLRRPMLVSGPPGSGKSTLAYAIAHELGLGRVLHWPITSQVTAVGGLYTYDPLARLYAASQRDGRTGVDPLPTVPAPRTRDETTPEDIGQFVTLGPLGTALLPWGRPRVLLIDEIDKVRSRSSE